MLDSIKKKKTLKLELSEEGTKMKKEEEEKDKKREEERRNDYFINMCSCPELWNLPSLYPAWNGPPMHSGT